MFILLECAFVLQAQQVFFQLSKLPAENETIFLAGNMNGWKPNDASYKFDAKGRLIITAKRGDVLEFKCTQGSWEKVEVSANGKSIGNRVLVVNNDTTLSINIAGWNHLFENKGKQHTASINVSIFDTAFLFPSLGYRKTVRVYLPPDYNKTNKKYAVLYMHDGQNVFDEFTSAYGEWKVDEALDSVYKASGKSLIVVAIDHSNEKRLNEYNPFDSTSFGQGYGELYLKDMTTVLKPVIDKNFRTSSKPRNTWIAGSSMGGLVTAYGVFIYPSVFGGAGVFSPAFWVNKSVEPSARKYAGESGIKNKFYFYAGGKESRQMIPDMKKITGIVCAKKPENCFCSLDENAQHNELAWSIHFHSFLQFMMANGALR